MRCCWVVWSLSLQVDRVFCILISAAGPSAILVTAYKPATPDDGPFGPKHVSG
jgi:hypothetical protein